MGMNGCLPGSGHLWGRARPVPTLFYSLFYSELILPLAGCCLIFHYISFLILFVLHSKNPRCSARSNKQSAGTATMKTDGGERSGEDDTGNRRSGGVPEDVPRP